MSERCPIGEGIVWESKIPEVCRENCEELWLAAQQQPPILDLIDEFCEHDLEFGGATLMRTKGTERCFTILNVCIEDGIDISNDFYYFNCPNE